MTLGEAILAAHKRGDTEERNRLMAWANQGVTIRDLQSLLGCCLQTAHTWTVKGRRDLGERPLNQYVCVSEGGTLHARIGEARDASTSGPLAAKE